MATGKEAGPERTQLLKELANRCGLSSNPDLLSLTWKSPELEPPHGGAFGTPLFFPGANLSSQSWAVLLSPAPLSTVSP